jgi:hypothetical protein
MRTANSCPLGSQRCDSHSTQHFDFPQSPARLDAGRSADNISFRLRRSIEGLPCFIFRFVCGPLVGLTPAYWGAAIP